jgi:hypothetical protein
MLAFVKVSSFFEFVLKKVYTNISVPKSETSVSIFSKIEILGRMNKIEYVLILHFL